jgi:alkanesulfonate monooxygenase SsuD/methylene tetrahydromethanopterin reductase-like flavin-dependent oxidoreductase (luciferase family)
LRHQNIQSPEKEFVLQIGIDSFAASIPDPVTGVALSPTQRMQHLLEEITLADQSGLDVFGIGEHHRPEFLDSAPPVILGAAAALTKRIRLTSAVTVLSAADPVRVFQQFATLDLISRGRAEIVAGRGSFVESFPLFGLALDDYDSLFAEKLELLLKIRENTEVYWSGKHRAPLTGQSILRARRGAGASSHGCHHRRRATSLSSAHRAVPRGGAPRRPFA